MNALLIVLYFTLASLLATSCVMLFYKKDGKKNEKISLVATLSMSVATIAVGISTVNVAKNSEARERLSKQPLFSVKMNPSYSTDKAVFDNEEYIITNEGTKTKIKTTVDVCSFLEIEYFNTKNQREPIRKRIPIIYFNGGSIVTNNLDGVIAYSVSSGNNNECYNNIYREAMLFNERHPETYITILKENYFYLHYTDLYGETHNIVKTEETEIDPEEFIKIKDEAYQNTNGKALEINKINLELLINLF